MTDTISFYRNAVNAAAQFITAYENLLLIHDRIAADSALSTGAAAAAVASGRADLSAADFDNLKVATDLIASLLAATTGGNVPVTINTGGKVVLAFYKLM